MSTSQEILLKNSQGDPLVRVVLSQLPSATGNAVNATLSTLYGPSAGQSHQSGATPATILAQSAARPPTGVQEYLVELTAKANAAANALFCGSILAGRSSESDEFGDVAFWLGEGQYEQEHERAALRALGLETHLGPNTKIAPIEISTEARLPSSTAGLVPGCAEAAELVGLLSRLTKMYAFTVESRAGAAGTTAYFLLGYHEAAAAGWVGLLGLGVQT